MMMMEEEEGLLLLLLLSLCLGAARLQGAVCLHGTKDSSAAAAAAAPAGAAGGAAGAVALSGADVAGSLKLGRGGGCPQFGKSLIFLTFTIPSKVTYEILAMQGSPQQLNPSPLGYTGWSATPCRALLCSTKMQR